MFYLHNISDVCGPERRIKVQNVVVMPGNALPLPSLGKQLQRSLSSPQDSGLLLVLDGKDLPEWVQAARISSPVVTPEVIVEEPVVEEETPADDLVVPFSLSDAMNDMDFSGLKELLEKVTGEEYSGRRSSKSVRTKLLELDLELVRAALE